MSLGTRKSTLEKIMKKRLAKMSPEQLKALEKQNREEYEAKYYSIPDPPPLFQVTARESEALDGDYIIDTEDEDNQYFGGGKRRRRSKRRRRRPSTKKRVARKSRRTKSRRTKSRRSKTRRAKSHRSKTRRRSKRRSRRN
jgi:hypothetical protein